MTIKPRFGFVVEYVKDLEAARRFYTEVLGLEIERHHPAFIQFGPFAVAADQPMAGGVEPELYWLVDDVQRTEQDLPATADVCLPLTQMPFGKVLGIRNTEGRPCYLLELAKDRPSRPAS